MPILKINYDSLFRLIKRNKVVEVSYINKYLNSRFGITDASVKSSAITRLVKRGMVERIYIEKVRYVRFIKNRPRLDKEKYIFRDPRDYIKTD